MNQLTQDSIAIETVLHRLDLEIANHIDEQANGLLSGLGGGALYFANRYKQTGSLAFHTKAVNILDRIIEQTNSLSVLGNPSIGNPVVTGSWVVNEFIRLEIIDADSKEISDEIVSWIKGSLHEAEFNGNYHDLFYGFIGKGVLIHEHDNDSGEKFVHQIIDRLVQNFQSPGFWYSPEVFWDITQPGDRVMNFGIPHGMSGILLFLLKHVHSYHDPAKLRHIITQAVRWITGQLTAHENKLPYVIGKEGSGRLAWCYGDLALSYMLLRCDEVLHLEMARLKAHELLEASIRRPVTKAGIHFAEGYGFLDVGICHGLSGGAHLFHKMYEITADAELLAASNRWWRAFHENFDIMMSQLDFFREKEKDGLIDVTPGFLCGLSGTGLALITSENPTLRGWEKLLLLDRP